MDMMFGSAETQDELENRIEEDALATSYWRIRTCT